MDSCPKELEPYDTAHKVKIKEMDYLQYVWWGSYGKQAMYTAVDHCLAGRQAKSNFIDKPVFSELLKNNGLTKEQIYEKEMQKALLSEEQWIAAGKRKGLPETII